MIQSKLFITYQTMHISQVACKCKYFENKLDFTTYARRTQSDYNLRYLYTKSLRLYLLKQNKSYC